MDLYTTTANKATDAITTDVGTNGYIMIYTGTAPAKVANAYVAATGTLLVTMAMSNPIGPASSNGVLTLSAITTTVAVASGTPGYFRICTTNSDGTAGANCRAQGTCAVGSGEINFGSTVASGGNVSITTGMTITNPAAA